MKNILVIDGVFFQINEWSGIAKYWKLLLKQLDQYLSSGSADQELQIYLLARGDSKWLRNYPFQEIKVIPYQFYDPIAALSDYIETGSLCKQLDAKCFISTYYTLAYGIANIGFAYDFIPENLGTMDSYGWKLKELYMKSIRECFSISESTSRDASIFYPNIKSSREMIIYPPLAEQEFNKVSKHQISKMRKQLNINYPYAIVSGHRGGYKNINLLGEAIKQRFLNSEQICLGIVVTSGEPIEDDQASLYSKHFSHGIKRVEVDNELMRSIFGGAEMLFYPSLLEGFGYPVAEALAAQCPVITTGSTSIPEIIQHAKPGEYELINGYEPGEALSSLIRMLHKRPKVSSETVSNLQKAFSRFVAPKFIEVADKLSQELDPPDESYLSACITMDGLVS